MNTTGKTTASPAPQPTRRATILYRAGMVAVLLLATFLRFYALDQSSLWSDEGNTWAMLGRDFGAIAQAAAADIHPPGYYWLLKVWSLLFGASAYAMRSFSAVMGVLLVIVIARTGRYAAPTPEQGRWLGLLAALLAAVSPFQIYYSQEARMYMLLALESALLFYALLAMAQAQTAAAPTPIPQSPNLPISQSLFVLAGIAGLWTHYSFPVILAAAGLAYFARWLYRHLAHAPSSPLNPSPLRFVMLNALILLAFLPWLPVALPAVINWPKGGVEAPWLDGIALTLRTLLFGPVRMPPEPAWLWLLAGALLPGLGIFALRRCWSGLVLGLWLLLPVGLMAVLGLFTPAFLKFLLAAAPAWCLLAAAAALLTPRIWPGALSVALFAAAVAATTLPAYYTSPTVRDNYRGIAAYLAAAGDPAADLVLLDAPGQQEVWRYYDPGLPVLALPAQRPPDPAQTAALLAQATADRSTVYALFWAMDEADPAGIVERWLDAHAFKGLDAWQGNVRFVTYALGAGLVEQPSGAPAFGAQIKLVSQAQPAFPQRVTAGAPLRVRLHWQAAAPLEADYAVSVQLLDSRNQVVAQHDGQPAGGSLPTSQWTPGARVTDNHAVFVPFGTPPGAYRLIVTVYDPATGARLLSGDRDHIELGNVEIARPADVPAAVVPMQHRVAHDFDAVTLVGYDAYRKGAAHAPGTPLAPGDLVHFTFYWQAPAPLSAAWPADAAFTLHLGDQTLTAPLAGGAYPTAAWLPGEFVRGDFDLPFDGSARQPALTIGDQTISLEALP